MGYPLIGRRSDTELLEETILKIIQLCNCLYAYVIIIVGNTILRLFSSVVVTFKPYLRSFKMKKYEESFMSGYCHRIKCHKMRQEML